MRKKIINTLLVASAITAASLATAPAAQAGPQAEGLLLGQHQNLGGAQWFFNGSQSNLGSIGAGDKASSARNDDRVAWVLYDDAGYSDRRCLAPGRFIRDPHYGGWNFGDKISSVKRLTTASCSGYPVF
ncbi:hypothetical protein ACWDYJ_30280 [Streptomyces sp. NPDC003042]